jgi:hypothetical protein
MKHDVKIAIKAKTISLEIEAASEALASKLYESLEVAFNGGAPSQWLILSKASPYLGTSRNGIYDKIQQCERDRATGSKADWQYGKHYRRRNGVGLPATKLKMQGCIL